MTSRVYTNNIFNHEGQLVKHGQLLQKMITMSHGNNKIEVVSAHNKTILRADVFKNRTFPFHSDATNSQCITSNLIEDDSYL